MVLGRKKNEVITVGHKAQLRITILEVRRDGTVRLGFDADPSVPIHRLEVFDAIQRQKAADAAMERIEKGNPWEERCDGC